MKRRIATTLLLSANVLIITLLFAGCSKDQGAASSNATPASKTAASISANPNPVPPGEGFGTSTITWNTGDGSVGQVYVALGDNPEKLFADQTSHGSNEAPWIGVGTTYIFRLYAGTEHKTVLASVKVVRAER